MKARRKLIDVLMIVLFVLQLFYVYTGEKIHMRGGICLLILVGIHIYLDRYFFKKKMSKRDVLFLIISLILLVSLFLLAVTGIFFKATRWHLYLTYAALFTMMLHIFLHALRFMKKKRYIIISIVLIISIMFASVSGLPYLDRHFKTVSINTNDIKTSQKIDTKDHEVLIVYFTRVGNSQFEKDIDAVSGASLMIDQNDTLYGNTQILAMMIQNMTDCDMKAIQTEKIYPSSYDETTAVAKKEFDNDELPELKNIIDVSNYDTIILVYPLWWSSIPQAVKSFLIHTDLNSKTLIPVVSHGGGGFGNSIKDIKQHTNAEVLEKGIAIYCSDVTTCENELQQMLEDIFQ